jgi:ABC-type multidrug transport system ATPase subunit
LIGLIPQHDALLPDATVRENILYSGRVLLGGQQPECQIQEYVDFLISTLGLQSIRDQLVGGLIREGGRGISGGEYKRVSIAVALAAAPLALILDEPTSGLDATAAHSLMKLLHSISRQGIIVVCVIHQPRVEIFRLLDDLLVLNGGAQVYLGKAADAQPFFEKVGHGFPAASNPADVMLDILSDDFPTPGEEKYPAQASTSENASAGACMTEEALVMLFRTVKQRRASWIRQLWLAFSRSTAQQCRQTTSLALEIVSSAVTGLMIGLAAFESRGHFFQGIYHDSYGFLSSAVEYRLIAEQGLLCCLAIGTAPFDFPRFFKRLTQCDLQLVRLDLRV